ncbi:MAG: alpha-amylase family glycosyl hydrolase [Marinilabiliaceae bacterium]
MNICYKILRNVAAAFGALALMAQGVVAQDLPADIQKGNILHCFDWTMNDVKDALPQIAEAGFGAVQLSPLQRNVTSSSTWYDAYRPFDFAFVSSCFGTEQNLKDLCSAANALGIKVIVDVVFNHVDGSSSNKTSYHNDWWNSNNRLRWNGDVDYSSRESITQNQMGGGSGYPDVNSEDSEVAARAKAYVEWLKACGVKGIRFDAAKHVALPSENCNFWKEVCSVEGIYYYGEVLDNPGGSNKDALMMEYTEYMSVTDNSYGDNARNKGGVPTKSQGWGIDNYVDQTKLVYWAESHDTYCNDGGSSKNVSVDIIDRTYAMVACRNNENALYFSRPSSTSSSSIKCGSKGSTHFTSTEVAEVNKFRNAMVGKADFYTTSGTVGCVTRENGGAVIVSSTGAADVSIANGGSYVPEGTYTDKIGGGTFTVTSSTISGKVGSTGIAVIYEVDPEKPTISVSPANTTFETKLTVSLSATPEGTAIYYTTDGSAPTTSSTIYSAPFSIESTTTVNILAVSPTSKTSTKSVTYTLKGSEEDEYAQLEYYDNCWFAYFKNLNSWTQVGCWAWNDNTNYTDGICKWPGVECTLFDAEQNIYLWKAEKKDDVGPSFIIFNSFQATGASQTDNMTFENGGIYEPNSKKPVATVTKKETQAIANIGAKGLKIFGSKGTLVLEAEKAQEVIVSNLSGKSQRFVAHEGRNIISLSRGLYVVGGKLIAVK